MFYACLAVLILFGIMCFCVTIAIIDLEAYNFGLYIVLLCIVGMFYLPKTICTPTPAVKNCFVGTMLACALCIANPNACPNPVWYSNFCLMLQEMYPAPDGTSSPKMTGLRSRMMAMQTASATHHSTTNDDGKLPVRNESRATVAMLAPAVHIMHQVWKGMAWVADGIDEDDEDPTRSYDNLEVGQSTSDSDAINMKRLSTVIEHDQEELGSDFASCHDVMV